MSVIKVEDISYVRFRLPDLEAASAFVTDFGLTLAEATSKRIVARGAGPQPVVYVAERGEPGFVGMSFRAPSTNDLHRLANHEGVEVLPLELPGGGKVVTLHDPDGNQVEIIADQSVAQPITLPKRPPSNSGHGHLRVREVKRIAAGPATVLRLGHAVINVADFRASEAWYKERFGFITSDEIEAAPDQAIGAFLRCDRGETPTDHHTVFLMQARSQPGFNHAAFEVVDLDDLMIGHAHLKAAGRTPEWGVGRHVLGSQVFDYWRDPWGHILEHWTDGDLFTARDGSNKAGLKELLDVQWGQQRPAARE